MSGIQRGQRRGTTITIEQRGSALVNAVRSGASTEVVKLALEQQAFVNFAEADGTTACHVACESGAAELLALLLEYQASVRLEDSMYSTPLDVALRYGREECIRLLLSHGADPWTVRSETLEFAEARASMEPSYAACLQRLATAEANGAASGAAGPAHSSLDAAQREPCDSCTEPQS